MYLVSLLYLFHLKFAVFDVFITAKDDIQDDEAGQGTAKKKRNRKRNKAKG